MQRNSERTGMFPPKNCHVPNLRYAYDAIQDGRVTVSWKTASTPASARVSECPWGECVITVTGGDIIGADYLGQLTMETVAAEGESKKAFAYILSAPSDTVWSGRYGLPYKMHGTPALDDISGSTIILTAPATDEDERGTWIAGAVVGSVVEFSYAVDTTNLHGDAYDDIKSGDFDTQTLAITGTIDSAGLVTIDIPSTGGQEVPCEIVYPDKTYGHAMSGTSPTKTLSPLWMQQYGRIVGADATALGNLVTVDPLGNEYAPVYVQLTGTAAPAASFS